ncbi:MAG: DUF1194 domain-containing protein [Methylobacteriaceae bacterium]|nr:DUF1194 domain-containing protein [Methylobacteriaceae bacterium]
MAFFRAFLTAALAAAMLWPGPAPGGAARAEGGAVKVDVELVIAVDISYSMDEEEQRLQRIGYIEALTSRQFHDALKSGAHGQIAVAYMEWAGAHDARVLVNWMLIDGPETARVLADKLAEAPTRRARRTSISTAIDKSVQMFSGNGYDGIRRVIDISGDGPNNDGRHVVTARDEALARGFVINGLPVVLNRPNYGWGDIKDLDIYYQDCVIGGPGAFMVPIRTPEHFVEATRTKLVMEVASAPPAILPDNVQPAQNRAPRVSCTIGERMWQDRWGN